MQPVPALLVVFATACTLCSARAEEGPNPSFNLVNQGRAAIREVYATPSTTDRWGGDRLTHFLLPPGQTFPLRLPADGTCLYDIRIVYDGRPAEEARRIDLCRAESIGFPGTRLAAATGNAPAGPGRQSSKDPSFRLINRSRAEINEVYASPVGDDQWGEDRLGEDTVSGGGTRVMRLPNGQCLWDVRVVFADGASLERRKLDLCAVTDLRVP